MWKEPDTVQQPARSNASPDTAACAGVVPTAMLKQILIPSLLMNHGPGDEHGATLRHFSVEGSDLVYS